MVAVDVTQPLIGISGVVGVPGSWAAGVKHELEPPVPPHPLGDGARGYPQTDRMEDTGILG